MDMRRSIWLFLIALVLTSCLGTNSTQSPTIAPNAIMTSVQLTVNADLTSIVALTPSSTVTPTVTETSTPTTPAPVTPTSSNTPAVTSTKGLLADQAQLSAQSIPDKSKFNPGAPFKVTWTFLNLGTTTWTTSYTAKFWSDDLMGSPNTVFFTKEVKPNESIDITMNFKAPVTIGSAKSSWWLQNADGVNFFPFFIAIEVISALPTPSTSTATKIPTITLTTSP
jgi:hypothetical protein